MTYTVVLTALTKLKKKKKLSSGTQSNTEFQTHNHLLADDAGLPVLLKVHQRFCLLDLVGDTRWRAVQTLIPVMEGLWVMDKGVNLCVCVCVCVRARARTRINKQKQDYLRTVLNSPFSKLLVAISTLFINCLVF